MHAGLVWYWECPVGFYRKYRTVQVRYSCFLFFPAVVAKMRLEQVFRVQQSLETTQDGPCWYPMGCLVYDVHMPHIFTYFQSVNLTLFVKEAQNQQLRVQLHKLCDTTNSYSALLLVLSHLLWLC